MRDIHYFQLLLWNNPSFSQSYCILKRWSWLYVWLFYDIMMFFLLKTSFYNICFGIFLRCCLIHTSCTFENGSSSCADKIIEPLGSSIRGTERFHCWNCWVPLLELMSSTYGTLGGSTLDTLLSLGVFFVMLNNTEILNLFVKF